PAGPRGAGRRNCPRGSVHRGPLRLPLLSRTSWKSHVKHRTTTRGLLAEELARAEPEIDLARAALLIAKEEYPQLSVELYLARLDQVAEEVKDRLADETAPPLVLQELIDTLYRRRGFGANRKAYYDPRNSFLN